MLTESSSNATCRDLVIFFSVVVVGRTHWKSLREVELLVHFCNGGGDEEGVTEAEGVGDGDEEDEGVTEGDADGDGDSPQEAHSSARSRLRDPFAQK